MAWFSHGLWDGGWAGEFQIARDQQAQLSKEALLACPGANSHTWFLT